MANESAELILKMRTAEFNRNMSKTQSGLKSFGKQALKIGAIMTAITLPIVLFGKSAVDAASDAGEVSDKFGTVFLAVRKDAEKTAISIAKSYGLAISTSKELLSSTGDILSGFGFTDKKSFELSQRVLKLGADLASFSNIEGGATRAVQALTKALVGETESAKALGVVIRQNSKEFKNLVKEGMEMRGETLLQAKAMAALTIAVRQSPKAIGDTARTWNSYANIMKRVGERTKELRESWGRLLIDVLKLDVLMGKLSKTLKSTSTWLNNLSPAMKKLVVWTVAILVTIGPLLLILGSLAFALNSIIVLAGSITAFMAAGSVGAILLGVALSALGTIILATVTALAFLKVGSIIAEMTGLKDAIVDLTYKWFLLHEEIARGNTAEAQSLQISALRASLSKLSTGELMKRKKIVEDLIAKGNKEINIAQELKIINNKILIAKQKIEKTGAFAEKPIEELDTKALESKANLERIIEDIQFRRSGNQGKLNILQERLNVLTTAYMNANDRIAKFDLKGKIAQVGEEWDNINKTVKDTFNNARLSFFKKLEQFNFRQLTNAEKINFLIKKRDELLEKASKIRGAERFNIQSNILDVMDQLRGLQGGITQAPAQQFTEATFADTVEAQRRQFGGGSTEKQTEINTKKTANETEKIAQNTADMKNMFSQPSTLKMA